MGRSPRKMGTEVDGQRELQWVQRFGAVTGAVDINTTPSVQYTYSDPSTGSLLTSMVYPNGRTIDYSYGSGMSNANAALDQAIGRLDAIVDGANSGDVGQVLEQYSYLGLSNIVARNHPQSFVSLSLRGANSSIGSGGDQYFGLDRFGRVVNQEWSNRAGSVSDRFTYSYDNNSNVTAENNLLDSAYSQTFTYDPLNRLTANTLGGVTNQSWNLDSQGNWSSVTTNGTTQTRTANAQNQITSISGTSATPTYDANGNMISDQNGDTLTYDAWNRLVKVTNSSGQVIAQYSYDARGYRISETYPQGGSVFSETPAGTTKYLYYSTQEQVLEERWNGTVASDVAAQNVWSAAYVNALVLRDQQASGGTVDTTFGSDGLANTTVTGGSTFLTGLVATGDGTLVALGWQILNGTTSYYLEGFNADGSADTAFGSNGVVMLSTSVPGLTANSVAVQANGDILVGGTLDGQMAVACFNPDGSLNTSFGVGGVAATALTESGVQGGPMSVAANGTIALLGSDSAGDIVVAEFNADGTRDAAFGGSGAVVWRDPGMTGAAITLDSQGRVLIAGATPGNQAAAVARLTASGQLDTSFSTNGMATVFAGSNAGASEIAVDSQGRIVIAGVSYIDNPQRNPDQNQSQFVARLNANGTVDTSFGYQGGTITTYDDFATNVGGVDALLIQSDGEILVVSDLNNGNDIGVARYTEAGNSDNTYGGSGTGYAEVSVPGGLGVSAGLLDGSGELVLAGGRTVGSQQVAGVLLRLDSGTGLEERVYALQDANWNVVALTDSRGNILGEFQYDAYGNVTRDLPYNHGLGMFANPIVQGWQYLYQGGRQDPITGLYHFDHRDYSTSLGTWISQDPLQYINGANTYQFVMSNPVDKFDPKGLELACQSGPWGVPPGQLPSPTVSGLLQDAQAATADAWSGLSNGWNGFNNWAVAATNGLGNLINKIPALGMVLPGGEFAPEGKVIGELGEQLAKDIKPKAEPEPETKGPARKAYPDEGHHFLPKQFADKFKKVGLNPDDFVEPLPKDVHRLRPGGIHTGPHDSSWNGQWQQFFNDNPIYTQQDVLNQLAKMKKSFGIK